MKMKKEGMGGKEKEEMGRDIGMKWVGGKEKEKG